MGIRTLLRRRRAAHEMEAAHAEARVEEAGRLLAGLEERAERVSTSLGARRQRNHWSEAIASVYRGGGPAT